MLKSLATFEEKIEDRQYILLMPPNPPAGEVLDVLYKIRAQVVEIINNAHKADEPKKPEEQQEVINVE